MKRITTLLTVLAVSVITVHAQPGPDQLADLVLQKNNENLSNIETLSMTVETFMTTTTSEFEKVVLDGMSILRPIEGEEDAPDIMNSAFGTEMYDMIRSASSVTEESVNGHDTYKVFIDDPEAINQGMMSSQEIEESMEEIKSLTIWIDSSELIPRMIRFESVTEDQNEINGEMTMNDYQNHAGLPIAHLIELRIEGIGGSVSEEDMARMRQQVAELETQMDNMPENVRSMMEEQLKPQMEALEAMMGEGGEAGVIPIRVLDVQVNQ